MLSVRIALREKLVTPGHDEAAQVYSLVLSRSVSSVLSTRFHPSQRPQDPLKDRNARCLPAPEQGHFTGAGWAFSLRSKPRELVYRVGAGPYEQGAQLLQRGVS